MIVLLYDPGPSVELPCENFSFDSHILTRLTCDGTQCFICDLRAILVGALHPPTRTSPCPERRLHQPRLNQTALHMGFSPVQSGISARARRLRAMHCSLPGQLDDEAVAADGQSLALALVDHLLRFISASEGHETSTLGLALVVCEDVHLANIQVEGAEFF